uniref:Uncharacterized protein n=1 Tax=Caenorhabditis japonica TaxID=281687 RepID=A0A8R1IIF4_CAEJA
MAFTGLNWQHFRDTFQDVDKMIGTMVTMITGPSSRHGSTESTSSGSSGSSGAIVAGSGNRVVVLKRKSGEEEDGQGQSGEPKPKKSSSPESDSSSSSESDNRASIRIYLSSIQDYEISSQALCLVSIQFNGFEFSIDFMDEAETKNCG